MGYQQLTIGPQPFHPHHYLECVYPSLDRSCYIALPRTGEVQYSFGWFICKQMAKLWQMYHGKPVHCMVWANRCSGQHGIALAILKCLNTSLVGYNWWATSCLPCISCRNMAKWPTNLPMPPQTLEMRIPKACITVFYRLLLKHLFKQHMHYISAAKIAYSLHDIMFQPYITDNTYVDPVTNDKGEFLLLFCHNTQLSIANTWYINTAVSIIGPGTVVTVPLGSNWAHTYISHHCQSYIINCRVYQCNQLCNTDHSLLTAQLRIRLKVDHSAKLRTRLNLSYLWNPYIAITYTCNISNRLSTLSEEHLSNWQYFKGTVNDAAKEAIGYLHQMMKWPWISNEARSSINAMLHVSKATWMSISSSIELAIKVSKLIGRDIVMTRPAN